MELMKKLKAKSMKKAILPILAAVLVAVILLAVSDADLLFRKPVNLYDVPREELEGKYVTAEIPFIWESYAYTEEYKDNKATGRITSCEYIIDANEEDFCGLLLPESLVDEGNALLEESDQYYYGKIDEMTTTMTVKGIVKAMPEDSVGFYHETVGFDGIDAKNQQYFLPLYLVARDGGSNVSSVILLVLALGCLAFAAFKLVSVLSGKNQKQILKKANELSPGNPDYILQHAEQLYSTPGAGGLRFNGTLILVEEGAKQYLYGANELIWAYRSVIQHKTNGVPTGKSYQLVLVMRDGSMRAVPMPSQTAEDQLVKISALLPNVVVGYDEQLAQLFNKKQYQDLAAEAARHQAARAQAQAEAQAAAESQPEAPTEA